MVKIYIDNLSLWGYSTINALEACELAGITIPRFCYHKNLLIAGNCRMCLIEIKNSLKLVPSCSLTIMDGMSFFTNSPAVKKARETILESLLLSHPLDCPICDQAGECDLQDQAKKYGSDQSRFFFNKKFVSDKPFSSLIRTIMSRCILCTRCVRFNSEIGSIKSETLGVLGRGEASEIGGYSNRNNFYFETLGSIVDLCPVGALTFEEYSFKHRPWEEETKKSIDLLDGIGSNIYVSQVENTSISRVTPQINDDMNSFFISDKSRFSSDSTNLNRLLVGFEKNLSSKKFDKLDFHKLKSTINISKNQDNKKFLFLVDDEADLNSLINSKNSSFQINSEIYSITNVTKKNFYTNSINSDLKSANKNSSIYILISSNIRIESSILNLRLKNKVDSGSYWVLSYGQNFNETFPVQFLNLNLISFILFLEGKIKYLTKIFYQNLGVCICFGENLFKRGFSFTSLSNFLLKINKNCRFINLRTHCNSESLEFLNIKTINSSVFKKNIDAFCLNIDESDFLFRVLFSSKKKITLFWINSHGSKFAEKSDFIFPCKDEYETKKVVINLEKRPQISSESKPFNHNTSDSLDILIRYCFLNFNFVCYEKEFNHIFEMCKYSKLYNLSLHKNLLTQYFENSFSYNVYNLLSLYPCKSMNEDFYLTSKSLKSSKRMIEFSTKNNSVYKRSFFFDV